MRHTKAKAKTTTTWREKRRPSKGIKYSFFTWCLLKIILTDLLRWKEAMPRDKKRQTEQKRNKILKTGFDAVFFWHFWRHMIFASHHLLCILCHRHDEFLSALEHCSLSRSFFLVFQYEREPWSKRRIINLQIEYSFEHWVCLNCLRSINYCEVIVTMCDGERIHDTFTHALYERVCDRWMKSHWCGTIFGNNSAEISRLYNVLFDALVPPKN